MSCKVMTVMGEVSSDSLGNTSSHDHLITGMPGWEADSIYSYDKEAVLKRCVEEVNEAKGYGMNTMIEATCSDLARDPELFRNVMDQTGVNIICSTGIYTEAMGNVVYWNLVRNYVSYEEALKRLVASYIKDLTVGINDTDIKAGVLKVATGEGKIADVEALSIEAAAIAQKETGVPVISHTENGTMGPEMAEMLIEKGADPKKVMIGHSCDTDDIDYMLKILDQGVYIGFDRLGYDVLFPDEKKLKNILKLVEMGYEDKILIGHDYTVHTHGVNPMEQAYKMMTNLNLSGIFKTFIPQLKEMGLSDIQAQKLIVDNPRRFFEGA